MEDVLALEITNIVDIADNDFKPEYQKKESIQDSCKNMFPKSVINGISKCNPKSQSFITIKQSYQNKEEPNLLVQYTNNYKCTFCNFASQRFNMIKDHISRKHKRPMRLKKHDTSSIDTIAEGHDNFEVMTNIKKSIHVFVIRWWCFG